MPEKEKKNRPPRPGKSALFGVYTTNNSVARAFRRLEEIQARTFVRQYLNDPALSARRPLYLASGLLIAAAIVLRSGPILAVGLLTLALVAVPEIWYAFGLRSLTFERAPEVTRAAFCDVVETLLTLENRGALPLPFVEVEDNVPDELTALGLSLDISSLPDRARLTQALGMWAFQRLRRRIYIRATRRGVFTFGPTNLKVTDPFGVLTREAALPSERALIVHPLVAPLERFGLTPKALFGDHTSRVRLLEDPLRMSGVRQYVPGDDPRRVHWKATARAGTLQSKILEPSTQRTMMIALDVRTFKLGQMGFDPELAELAISTAASVATRAFAEGYAVGVLSNGSLKVIEGAPDLAQPEMAPTSDGMIAGVIPRLRLEPSVRLERLTQVLDGLSLLLPYNGTSLASMLAEERQTLSQGASLVYIGLDTLVDVPTLIALREIRTRGRDVTLLLTAREEEDGDQGGDAHNLHVGAFKTIYVGGRTRWNSLLSVAYGDLPARRASAPATRAQTSAERAIIAERRKLRLESHPDGSVAQTPARSEGPGGAHDSEEESYATTIA